MLVAASSGINSCVRALSSPAAASGGGPATETGETAVGDEAVAREGEGGQEDGDEEGLGGEGIMTDEVAGEQVMFISEQLSA